MVSCRDPARERSKCWHVTTGRPLNVTGHDARPDIFALSIDRKKPPRVAFSEGRAKPLGHRAFVARGKRSFHPIQSLRWWMSTRSGLIIVVNFQYHVKNKNP
ncbi:MAG TPA: hypothetical protein VN728_07840 [Stellaceae bacterium]|nr:hypothetical protein [Stellaceae bacterium]